MAKAPSYFVPGPIQALPPRVFISYSHEDSEFAERLANDLARKGIVVWWDGWGIKVGDSLLAKIQEGIINSSYLAVILSPRSIASSWVQEELNAALNRQLRERRVVVLPILLEDCELPPFIAEKKYADFSGDYDGGLSDLLKALKPIPTGTHDTSEEGEYHHDYAFDWGMLGERYAAKADITTHSPKLRYSISCVITMIANSALSARFTEYETEGYPWAWRIMLLGLAEDLAHQVQTVVLIEGDGVVSQDYFHVDRKRNVRLDLNVTARRLGSDPGEDVLYEWASVLMFVANRHREGIRAAVSPSEREAFERWRRSHPLA